ncbi:MAG: hypothetical protein KF883_05980 [Thermomicrobiales bacterium]|nr:hypothetical protein [Thermomicrobiales bacterium]
MPRIESCLDLDHVNSPALGVTLTEDQIEWTSCPGIIALPERSCIAGEPAFSMAPGRSTLVYWRPDEEVKR